MERTFGIIKPDAVAAGKVGAIIQRIEAEGFKLLGLKQLTLSAEDSGRFYAVHRERPFYASLTRFMASGPIVVLALEREGAIARWRELMGATDPAKAAEGTLRKLFATNIERNAVHGSDAPETAAVELAFFFSALELAA